MIITGDKVLKVIMWISAIFLMFFIVATIFKLFPSADVMIPIFLSSTMTLYFACTVPDDE